MTTTCRNDRLVPVLLVLLSFGSVAWAPARAAVTPAVLSQLTADVAEGRCETALGTLKTLSADDPKNVELIVLEANCELQLARSGTKAFDPVAYERMAVARGSRSTNAAAQNAFFRQSYRFDEAGLGRALDLFRKAGELQPKRGDLFVGLVAALANSGHVADAAKAVASKGAAFGEETQDDMTRVVSDLLAQGLHAEALTLSRAVQAAWPNSLAAHRTMAPSLLANHEVAAGIKEMEALLPKDPANLALGRQLGTMLIMQRRFAAAVPVFARFIGEADDVLFMFALAQFRTVPPSSIPQFKELLARLKKKKVQETDPMVRVIAHYMSRAADGRTPSSVMQLRAAKQFADAGLTTAAMVELDEALAREPESVELWVKLADVYRRNDLFEFALDALDHARRGLGASAQGGVYSAAEIEGQRGAVLYGLSRDADAAHAFAAARAGKYPQPYEEGLVALALGKRDEAVTFFGEAAAAGGEAADWAKAKLAQLQTAAGSPSRP